ncbi:ladderlectin-like [Astatotilapia calliptera]|uniref:ladderlectin-like n=1 Tax=Astatotilapia calliptera TaxID=8154 RepID=UPI000E403637|nr:ladderlectin-like [Astatotilapia calliptera]XP_026019168.1 ladderlectin-like [Astatotilapia calliptera]
MKLLTVSALLCVMMAMSTVAAQRCRGCPNGWSRIHRRCFLYVPRAMNWATAERNCLSMGANLASVHTSAEHQLIQRLTAHNGYGVTWVGGTDASGEGIWLWSDGSRFNYQNWCGGEPNNYLKQDCLQINYSGSKCWDDQHCHVNLPSICARKISRRWVGTEA